MSTTKIVIVVLLITLAVFFGLRILSPEDTWICDKGMWIQHGHPKSPMPLAECPQK